MTGLFAICRRRKFRIGLLFAALLFAANGLIHPLFHGVSCRGERHRAVSVAASNRLDASASAVDTGKLHCPVCSGIFSAAAPAEPFPAGIDFLPEPVRFPVSETLLPELLPAVRRARAPPAA